MKINQFVYLCFCTLSVVFWPAVLSAQTLTLECEVIEDEYECVAPKDKTIRLVQPKTSESGDDHYIGLGFQTGSTAQYGFISRIQLFESKSRIGFSFRPSMFGGYDKEKVNQVQSVFEDIQPVETETANSTLPTDFELSPGIDPANLPAEYQNLLPTESSAGGISPDTVSDDTLARLEQNFKDGKYSELTEDDDEVEDYLFLQVGLPITLDFNISETVTLYAGGGYSLGFFQQASAGLITVGTDLYLDDDFVLNSAVNTYFYEDATEVNFQFGIGLTF